MKQIDVSPKELLIFGLFCLAGFFGFFILMMVSENKPVKSFSWFDYNTTFFRIEEDSFENNRVQNYIIDDNLFIVDIKTNDTEDYSYSFSVLLNTYQKKGSNNEVTINNVKVLENRAVSIDEVDKAINQKLEFSPIPESNVYNKSSIQLVDELNNDFLNANMHSTIKVVLNISVNNNGEIVTKDIEYIFNNTLEKSITKRYYNKK